MSIPKLPSFHILRTVIFHAFLTTFQKNVQATEVTVSWNLDYSLGYQVKIPVLTCQTKYTEFREIRWYKDFALLQKGPKTDYFSHMLVLSDFLNDTHPVYFDNPMKLQGYYWCETDYPKSSVVLKYLFKMKEVSTYVGHFLATKDSLKNDEAIDPEKNIMLLKTQYEVVLQNLFFDFLSKPNAYVTDIIQKESGLEVQFYVYVHQELHPRKPHDVDFQIDHADWQYILEYLKNETSTVDEDHYQKILLWTRDRGIDVKSIALYSTMGCYKHTSPAPGDRSRNVSWPDARLGAVVIPEEACSSKNGLAVTRLCGGNFYTGARWTIPYGKCEEPPSNLTLSLKSLYKKFGDDPKPTYIQELQNLTSNVIQLTVPDVHLILNILTQLSAVPELTSEEIDETFTVIDTINSLNVSEKVSAKATIKFTSRLLRVIDNILSFARKKSKEFIIRKNDFLVDTKSTKVNNEVEDHIIGIAVLPSDYTNTLEDASLKFLSTKSNTLKDDSMAYFLLPPELVINREQASALTTPCQINLVLFKDWTVFPKPIEVLHKRNYRVLPTPVMYVSLSGGPAWNLSSPVLVYFKNTYEKKIEKPVCVTFDPRIDNDDGGWSTEGCEYGGLKDGFYVCSCSHLSIFAVILSENFDQQADAFDFRLGTSIYVGCSISIIGLLFTIILYLLSKLWRSTLDHSILYWLAVSLLCCLILIFVSEMKFKWKPSCVLMGLLLHYFIIVTFAWFLVQSVMYRLRFTNKTDMDEVPHFLLKSFLSVWGSPILIMIIIWLTKDIKSQSHSNCWKSVSEVSYAAVIPIAVIIFVTVCLNMCAIYAVSCRFKKDFLIGNSIYKESVVKFRVAVTIFLFFVLTWLFGFFALNQKSKELKILFAISISLTSYYITLFFIFHEVSFWELCQKWKKDRKKEKPVETVKYISGGITEDGQQFSIPE